MSAPKNYFHDRLVLLMLSVSAFLVIACGVLVLLRIDTGQGSSHIIQYRSNLGLNEFKTGSKYDLIGFIVFSAFIFAFHSVLSYKTYHVRRYFSLAVLGVGILLLILSLVVSNALLMLS